MPSALGVLLFLIPFPSPRGPTILIGLIGYTIIEHINHWLPFLVVGVMVLSATGALVARLQAPGWIRHSPVLRTILQTSDIWLCVRVTGASLGVAVLFQIGPEWLWDPETGGLALYQLLTVLFIFFLLAGLCLPLLLDYGLVEMVGSLLARLLPWAFRVPGNSGVNIIASLLGDGTVGTLITARQYEKGYYTGREAAVIASTFSIVSISFCVVAVNFIGLSHLFLYFYITVLTTCLLIALVQPRIWPLNRIPDTYHPDTESESESESDPNSVSQTGCECGWSRGLQRALNKAAAAPSPLPLVRNGLTNALDIWFVFMPVIMTIACTGLIIAHNTSFFIWLGTPLVPILEWFEIPHASEVAPAVLLGFADMFLPVILCAHIESEMTRFIIAALSVSQLIYMSEIGVLILRSSIPLTFFHLLSLFIIRTTLALPLIVLFARYHFL